MSLNLPAGMAIKAPIQPAYESILTADALALVAKLHRAFEGTRQELLAHDGIYASMIRTKREIENTKVVA